MTITIMHDFTTLNEYTKTNRGNMYQGNKCKRDETELVRLHFLRYGMIKNRVRIKFKWILKNKRRDLDNIAFAKKFILDGMVLAGVLENDGIKHVIGFEDSYELGKEWGVEITIEEEN